MPSKERILSEMAELAEIHTRLREKGCGIVGVEWEQKPIDTMLDEEEEAEVVEILCPKCDAVVYTFERDLIIEEEEEDEE